MTTSKRILVVDDDQNICTLIGTKLTQCGHDVYTAGDGQEALDLFKEHPVDLAIVDVILPEMNGVNLAYEMTRLCPNLPILAISGGNNMVSKELCLQLMEKICAMETIEKPFELDDLMEKVNRLLELELLPPSRHESSLPAHTTYPLLWNGLVLE